MLNDPWQLLAAFGTVAVLSFMLGARWMKRELASRQPPRSQAPVTAAEPATHSEVLDALDGIQSELRELADRQDFAERLLMQRKHLESSAPDERGHVVTPV